MRSCLHSPPGGRREGGTLRLLKITHIHIRIYIYVYAVCMHACHVCMYGLMDICICFEQYSLTNHCFE